MESLPVYWSPLQTGIGSCSYVPYYEDRKAFPLTPEG